MIAREPPTLSVSAEGMSKPGNGVDEVTRGVFVAIRRAISGSSLLIATKIAASKDPPAINDPTRSADREESTRASSIWYPCSERRRFAPDAIGDRVGSL